MWLQQFVQQVQEMVCRCLIQQLGSGGVVSADAHPLDIQQVMCTICEVPANNDFGGRASDYTLKDLLKHEERNLILQYEPGVPHHQCIVNLLVTPCTGMLLLLLLLLLTAAAAAAAADAAAQEFRTNLPQLL